MVLVPMLWERGKWNEWLRFGGLYQLEDGI
jgi:hypothetical protein